MLPSEIDELLNHWFIGDAKVFKVRYAFSEPDILVIYKKEEGIYSIDLTNSTTKLFKQFTRDELYNNISNKKLVYSPNLNTYSNHNSIRAGQCVCGAWATRNPDCHAHYCPLYRNC